MPLVATAPGLCLPDAVQFQAFSKPESPTPKRGKKSAAAPAPSIVLYSSSHRTLDYTAKEDGPGGRESHLKHYIGVFDPKTGQLSVMEAKKMAVRGVVRSQKAPEDPIADRAKTRVCMRLPAILRIC
jgi:DNA-directed RNA polymerase I subunit RPA49